MMFHSDLLKGKVAIVTGCNRGIGKSILETLAHNGAIVYGVARMENSLLRYADCPNIIPCYFDVTDKAAISHLIAKIKKEHGCLDILVNNAGIMKDALIGMITDGQIKSTFDTNVFAPLYFIQYASKLMQRQKDGRIINIASIMGISGNYAQLVYSASKGAVIAMTKSAAKELAPYGIRVNAIAPGVIETDLLENVPEEKMKGYLSKIAMGKLGTPQDVADMVLFLASDLSAYVSGQVIGVDGMMSN